MQPSEKTLNSRGGQIERFLTAFTCTIRLKANMNANDPARALGYKYPPANIMIKHHKQANH